MKTWGSVGIFFFFPDSNNRKIHYLIIRGPELGDVEKGRGRPGNNWGVGWGDATGGGHPDAAFVQTGLVCCWFGDF